MKAQTGKNSKILVWKFELLGFCLLGYEKLLHLINQLLLQVCCFFLKDKDLSSFIFLFVDKVVSRFCKFVDKTNIPVEH